MAELPEAPHMVLNELELYTYPGLSAHYLGRDAVIHMLGAAPIPRELWAAFLTGLVKEAQEMRDVLHAQKGAFHDPR